MAKITHMLVFLLTSSGTPLSSTLEREAGRSLLAYMGLVGSSSTREQRPPQPTREKSAVPNRRKTESPEERLARFPIIHNLHSGGTLRKFGAHPETFITTGSINQFMWGQGGEPCTDGGLACTLCGASVPSTCTAVRARRACLAQPS